MVADSVVPSMLVAPPGLLKPPFDESVIILAGQKNNVVTGFILNRPIGLTLGHLLENNNDIIAQSEKTILFGGPSKKRSGFIMYEHSDNTPLDRGFAISPRISISPSLKLLKKAVSGDLPGRFELFLGCANWSTSQLFSELSQGDWLNTPFCEELLFDVEPEKRWSYSFKTLGLEPYSFVNVAGGAQA